MHACMPGFCQCGGALMAEPDKDLLNAQLKEARQITVTFSARTRCLPCTGGGCRGSGCGLNARSPLSPRPGLQEAQRPGKQSSRSAQRPPPLGLTCNRAEVWQRCYAGVIYTEHAECEAYTRDQVAATSSLQKCPGSLDSTPETCGSVWSQYVLQDAFSHTLRGASLQTE